MNRMLDGSSRRQWFVLCQDRCENPTVLGGKGIPITVPVLREGIDRAACGSPFASGDLHFIPVLFRSIPA
jgi:hypothetical protein